MPSAPMPWLTERLLPDASTEVDEQAGVIRNVRVCGRYSKNCHGLPNVTEGTEYTEACHRAARELYEGREVFTDHVVPNDRRGRSVHDTFGVLKDVRPVQEAEGTVTRADLYYLPDHPVAKNVIHSVRNKLGLFGLSHHAKPAAAKVINGRYVVERLERVESVDLVNRPATSKNLMESQAVATKKLREVLEGLLPKSKRPKDQLDGLKALLEMDDAPAVMDAPVDAHDADGGTDPDQAIDDAFRQAMHAQIDALIDGSHTIAELLSKIRELGKAHAKLSGGKDDSGDAGADEPPATESQEELRTLRGKVACFEAKVKPTPAVLKALGVLESEDDRKALLAELKGEGDKPGDPTLTLGTGTKPRSGAPMPRKPATTQESQQAPADAKAFAKSVLVSG